MKQIKVLVSFEDNEMIFPNIELVENDYNHVEFIFDFDEDDGKKVFELKKPNGKVFIKEIIDNKVVLSNLDEKGNIIPVINQSGKYEFEITKYKSDSKFTINKTCHFVARDEVVNVDDDIVDKDASLPILNDLITTTIALKENTEKVGQLTKEKGDYAEEQGNYAKKAASNVINANNQAAEIIKNFEFNVNEYTASFNKNATTKQDEFDSNSATEINEYNDNATLKLKSYNDNHEVKMKDYNDNASEKTKAFNSNAEVKTTAYDKNADDKLSAYNTNDATKLEEYNDNATLKIEEYNSNATQKLEEYDEHIKEYALKKDIPKNLSELKNDSNYVKNTDYATSTVAGVVKTNAGLDVDENGMVVANTCNYDEYESKTDNTFISKGTLENVITGKNLETANNKVTSVGTGSTDIEYPSAKCTYKIKEDVDNLKSDILETGEVSDSFIHVEDSIKNELLKLEVVGVCEQETTTGKNKLDMSSLIATTSKKGVTFTNNGDGTFNVIGTADADTFFDILSDTLNNVIESGKKYYLYSSQPYNENSFNLSVILNTDNGTKYYIANKATSSDFNTINNTKLTLYIPAGQTINAKNVKSMLVESDVADNDFEPYTGGQPSPNPEFPQEIKTITDSLIVTSCNKNLCNGVSQGLWIATLGYSYGTNSVDNGLCIPVDGISSYTISSKVTQARYRIGFTTQNPLVNTSGTCYRYSVVDGTNSSITKSSVGYKYLIVNASDLSSIQIEIGDKATPFEQHLETQITANLPEGEFIGKIDDTYKDTLKVEYNEEDGQYHLNLYKNVGKVVLDGSESWTTVNNLTPNYLYFATEKYDRIIGFNTFIEYSTHFSQSISKITPAYITDKPVISGTDLKENFKIRILMPSSVANDIKTFKTWLSTHNLEVYYVLENPYKVDLGIVDMPFSYDEVTNIFTDSELLPKINATYYRNFISTIRNLKVNNETLKNELVSINNRLAALENANASAISNEEKSEVIEK